MLLKKNVPFSLIVCLVLIILTLLAGGYTRLEDAGLSIVYWKPITGIIPPLNIESWVKEFELYKLSPEFKKLNFSMNLEEFKHIYFWEYAHRMLGRVLFVVYGLIYIRENISGNKKVGKRVFYIMLLVAFQGFMGWYMVKSGLVANPFVSHYRLAFHLITAIIIYSLTFYLILDIYFDSIATYKKHFSKYTLLAIILVALVGLQIFLGALVAGLDAGLIYNDFPLMGGNFIPSETKEIGFHFNLFNDPASVQFLHRTNAYILTIYSLFFTYFLGKIDSKFLTPAKVTLVLILFVQMILGISVVILIVPKYLALLHQLFSIFLLSVSLYIYFILINKFYRDNV